jgi:hypothetical protein
VTQNFKRKYSLTLGSFTTDKLRVTFDINKTVAPVPNAADIKVYGLSEERRENILSEFPQVILNAGYQGNEGQIFIGDPREMKIVREGPDLALQIIAADAGITQKVATVNKTLNGGTPVKQAVVEVGSTFEGVSIGELRGLDQFKIGPKGRVLSGQSDIVLTKLAEEFGFQWFINDGILDTVDKSGVIDTAYVISPDTGMIGQPQLLDTGQSEVSTLLNPRIKPGRIIEIRSDILQGRRDIFRREFSGIGQYKVVTVKYTGDTRGNTWQALVKGVPFNGE